MAYPPAVPPATRNNATPQHDNHPGDHNGISAALTDIINELGDDPSSASYPTVQARLEALKAGVDSVTGRMPRCLGAGRVAMGNIPGDGSMTVVTIAYNGLADPYARTIEIIWSLQWYGAPVVGNLYAAIRSQHSGLNVCEMAMNYAPG